MKARTASVSSATLAGAALAVISLAGSASAQVRRLERHFNVTGTPVVTVQNSTGRIQVTSWDKHEVSVVGKYASSNVGVDTEQADNRIEVVTLIQGKPAVGDDLKIDYEITVPIETELRVRTDSGNVTIESVHGDMSFDSIAADLALQDVQGFLMIKTIGGSLVCTRCAGRVDANSISGSFQFLQPDMDNVRVQTSSGNILFDGNFQSRGIYVLRNYSGTIEVRFSSNDSFDLNAGSLYGNVINQAPVGPDRHKMRGPQRTSDMARSLFGSMNNGQAKVELSSFSGTIKILKRE